MSARVRVAVALSGPPVPRWVADCLRALQGASGIELVLRIRPSPATARGGALARAYERLDRRLFARPEDSLAASELQLARELPESAVDAIEAIRAMRVEVLLWLAESPCPEGLADRLGCEVWCVRVGEGSSVSPLHRELLAGDVVSSLSLVRLAAGGRPAELLARSFGATDFSSPHRGRAAALAKAPGLVRRSLQARPSGKPSAEPAGDAAPRTGDVLRLAANVGWRLLGNRVQNRRTVEHWRMGVRRRREPVLADIGPGAFLELASPAGHFYADPIPFEHAGELFVFFEDLDFATNKGTIRCARLTSDGRPAENQLVLELPYHLSYPFVFRWRGEIWMIPETEQNGTIELWRPVEFPWRWRLEQVLFEGVRAFDTTLLERDGRLWLFANMSEPRASADDELFLFHADTLQGPWQPHPANPIVADVRRARPAGPLFSRGAELIRPAQDCSRTYGGAIVLNRVDVLNPAEYRETPVARIEPSWQIGAFGTHTIGVSEHLEVIDWKVRAPARDHRPR
jgi:hypothetical protein